MTNATKGWYIPTVKKLFVIFETPFTTDNNSNLERLKRIILARNLDDLRKVGNMFNGNDKGKLIEQMSIKQMTIEEAVKKDIEIIEVPLTERDIKLYEKRDLLKNQKQEKKTLFK